MAILFAANEPESFEITNAANVLFETDSSRYNSTFSRGAIGVYGTATNIQTEFDSQTELWVSFHFNFDFLDDDRDFLLIGDKDTGQGLLRIGTSANEGGIQRWNGSSWVDITTMSISNDVLYRIDIHIVVADSGSIDVYLDKVNVSSFSGDTNVTDVNNIGFLRLRSASTSDSPAFSYYYSQVIVATDDTRPRNVMTLYPNGTGASSEWSGSYTDIDEAVDGNQNPDDTDFISATASSLTHTVALSSATVSDYRIDALVIGARAQRGGSDPKNLKIGFRSSTGAEDYSTNLSGLSSVNFAPFQYISTANPADSAD